MTDPKTLTDEQILDAAEKAGLWPNTVHHWLPAFHRYHAILATREQTASTMTPAELAQRLKRGEKWSVAEQTASTGEHPGGCELSCPCDDRPLSECPGEWEPGCDLGANEKYAAPVEQAGSPGETTSEFAERAKWFGTPQSTYTPVDAVEQAGSTPDETLREALAQRITNYLSMGGLFNPEMADHNAVRDLLIDCRRALATPTKPEMQSVHPAAVSGKEKT